MGVEIERKFLLDQFPDLEIERGRIQIISRQSFEQTYLALTNNQELRVRKVVEEVGEQVSTTFLHTFKEGQGLARKEIEYEISEELYVQLIQGKQPLKKTRTKVMHENVMMEIDEYTGFDMLTVEVEFDSEEEANLFTPPAWFGEEVGSEKEYRNKTLWASLQKPTELEKSGSGEAPASLKANSQGSTRNLVLSQLARTLSSAKVGWAVGGSTLLAYYGIVAEPRDIDIIVQGEFTAQAEELLSQAGEHRTLASKAPFLTNRFYQIVIGQIEVDVMCGLRIEHDQGIYEYPFDSTSIAFHEEIDGQIVPFSYLEDWYVLYSLMPGREHRIESIEKYWETHGMKHPERLEEFRVAHIPDLLKEKLQVLKEQYKA